jgi:hypothetical protein
MKALQGLFSSFAKATDSMQHPFMVLVAFFSVVITALLTLLFTRGHIEGHIHVGLSLGLVVALVLIFTFLAAYLYFKEMQLKYAKRTEEELKQALRDTVLELQEGNKKQIPVPGIQIVYIECDPPGDDVQGEFVVIKNSSSCALDMNDWTLSDEAGHRFTFSAFSLGPGAIVRVWTGTGTNTPTDTYWGRKQAVWNNKGDCAYLRDGTRMLIDRYRC